MSDVCVVTMAIGEKYLDIFSVSGPTIRAYAEKIGADFIFHKEQSFASNIVFEKLVFGDYLKKYKRGLWVGADCIIRHDCPNVFKIVPEVCIGGVNDLFYGPIEKDFNKMVDGYQNILNIVSDKHGFDKVVFDGVHFNCDVLVASNQHSYLFQLPEKEIPLNMDQMLLNYRFSKNKTPRFTLSHRFNRIYSGQHFDEEICKSYIYHTAGLDRDKVKDTLSSMLKRWEDARCD